MVRSRLEKVLKEYDQLAVAVSGGVDSLTLSVVAAQVLGSRVKLYHAVSPAVPASATALVRKYAEKLGAKLKVIEAGEFSDEDYLSNPVNRCFYCKSNLYDRIIQETKVSIASGTNLDDLGDYRPGLEAAAKRQVRHPYVEANIDKKGVRSLATELGLDDIAELPAQPCLASRIETGIRVKAEDLYLVDRVEKFVRNQLGPTDIRCRIVPGGVRLEVPRKLLDDLGQDGRLSLLEHEVFGICRVAGKRLLAVSEYRRGSAFLVHDEKEGLFRG